MGKIITVETKGTRTYTGKIVEINPGVSVTIVFKPPRRPKPSELTVAWNDVVAVQGEAGEVGTLTVLTPNATVVTGEGELKKSVSNCITAVVGGAALYANPANARISALEDKVEDEVVGKKAKKGGKEKSAKAKPKSGKLKSKKK